MSNSPWNAYGCMPTDSAHSPESGPLAELVQQVSRSHAQVRSYLDGVMREFQDIRSGTAGYRPMIEDALTPSQRPETIDERLARLAHQAQARRRRGVHASSRRPAR